MTARAPKHCTYACISQVVVLHHADVETVITDLQMQRWYPAPAVDLRP
jgi:hypothetical protein